MGKTSVLRSRCYIKDNPYGNGQRSQAVMLDQGRPLWKRSAFLGRDVISRTTLMEKVSVLRSRCYIKDDPYGKG